MMDKGKKAKAWRVVKAMDTLLGAFEDDEVFGINEYRETQALIDALLRARMCASNILLRLGDDKAYRHQPRAKMTIRYQEEETSPS